MTAEDPEDDVRRRARWRDLSDAKKNKISSRVKRNFGKAVVRKLRKTAGMTVRDFRAEAPRAPHHTTVSNYERGVSLPPWTFMETLVQAAKERGGLSDECAMDALRSYRSTLVNLLDLYPSNQSYLSRLKICDASIGLARSDSELASVQQELVAVSEEEEELCARTTADRPPADPAVVAGSKEKTVWEGVLIGDVVEVLPAPLQQRKAELTARKAELQRKRTALSAELRRHKQENVPVDPPQHPRSPALLLLLGAFATLLVVAVSGVAFRMLSAEGDDHKLPPKEETPHATPSDEPSKKPAKEKGKKSSSSETPDPAPSKTTPSPDSNDEEGAGGGNLFGGDAGTGDTPEPTPTPTPHDSGVSGLIGEPISGGTGQ